MNTSQYRISKTRLLKTLSNWDSLMNFKVNLIACGGTALTSKDFVTDNFLKEVMSCS